MKTIMTFALAALLGLSSFANSADERIANLTVVQAKEKKVQVTLKEGVGKVKIHILDANGRRLHQRIVKVQKDVLVPFDMTALPSGEYQVAVISKETPNSQTLHKVMIEEKEIIEYPLMAYAKKMDDSSFKLTVIGLEKPRTTISIYDNLGRNIHNETIKEVGGISRVYHLKKLPLDNLSIIVRDTKGREKQLHL